MLLIIDAVSKSKGSRVESDCSAVNKAAEECNKFRLREGAIVQAKFIEYAQSIGSLLTEVEELGQTRIPWRKRAPRKSVSDLFTG